MVRRDGGGSNPSAAWGSGAPDVGADGEADDGDNPGGKKKKGNKGKKVLVAWG